MIKQHHLAQALIESDYFNSLPIDDSHELANRCQIIHIEKNKELIHHLDDDHDQLYILLKGSTKLTLISRNGRELICATHQPISMFGLVAAIDKKPHGAAIISQTKCTLAAIKHDEFNELMQQSSAFKQIVMLNFCKIIRSLNQRLFEMSTLSIRERVYLQLLRLCDDGLIDTSQSKRTIILHPAPTHATLASMVGTQREVISRELTLLAQQQVIDKKQQKTIHVNLHQLRQLAVSAGLDIN